MGCNCATQKQISKLYELYGDKKNKDIPKSQKIKTFLRNLSVYSVVLIISPLLISFVLYKAFFSKNKQISVRKLLRFNKKGIDEAIAKNIIENTTILNNE